MYGLSFREFLMFYKQIDIPVYSLQTILENPGNICREINEKCRPVQMFNEYLHEGYYPFFTGNREDYYINIENVVNDRTFPKLCHQLLTEFGQGGIAQVIVLGFTICQKDAKTG